MTQAYINILLIQRLKLWLFIAVTCSL
uniref:Uncharacterized protein n=1 Tax=Arundo donax TaxID=35708 RepID=A0A0A9BLU2_ARUDO